MTVYDEVMKERERSAQVINTLTCAANQDGTKTMLTILVGALGANEETKRTYLKIAALAIAAIEALDAEKGKEHD